MWNIFRILGQGLPEIGSFENILNIEKVAAGKFWVWCTVYSASIYHHISSFFYSLRVFYVKKVSEERMRAMLKFLANYFLDNIDLCQKLSCNLQQKLPRVHV
jgi:hypothetical protein